MKKIRIKNGRFEMRVSTEELHQWQRISKELGISVAELVLKAMRQFIKTLVE